MEICHEYDLSPFRNGGSRGQRDDPGHADAPRHDGEDELVNEL
jgi:hypothetical protein